MNDKLCIGKPNVACFFFPSRSRHTRFDCDWSSDVCSSDLQALQDAGGWASRDTAARFGEYADLMAAALGDRVKLWITLNEPFIHLSLGHLLGVHAPGIAGTVDLLSVTHHQLLGHGLAVAAIRDQPNTRVGIANNYTPVWAVGRTVRRAARPRTTGSPRSSTTSCTTGCSPIRCCWAGTRTGSRRCPPATWTPSCSTGTSR